jgi:hypothetical protein
MPTIRILDLAAEEAAEAAMWYEVQRPGLGTDFRQAVDVVLDLLESEAIPLTPVPGTLGKRGAKRIVLTRFPYNIVVYLRGDECVVVAFAHHSRRPGYWRSRIETVR